MQQITISFDPSPGIQLSSFDQSVRAIARQQHTTPVISYANVSESTVGLHSAGPEVSVASGAPVIHDISYSGEVLGQLVTGSSDASVAGQAAGRFAREVALLYKRFEARDVCRREFGRPEFVVGRSAAMARVEREIERAAAWDLPTVLVGEHGCQQRALAALVHVASRRSGGPLVGFNCVGHDVESLRRELPQVLAAAAGGTLLIEAVDALDGPSGAALAAATRRVRADTAGGVGCGVRIVATVEHAAYEHQSMCPDLVAAIDVVRVQIPPLRERPEDIDDMLAYTTERLGCREPINLTDDAAAMLRAYPWPGNLAELDRVASRLIALGTTPISSHELIRLAPEVGAAVATRGQAQSQETAATYVTDAPAMDGRDAPPPCVEELACAALANELACIAEAHPAVRAAVEYLANHSDDEITASQLARQSHVSMSHLAHLFKKELDMTFKQLLSQIRVERAKALLSDDASMRITDVSLSVGFGDLSHFLKTFRKLVGVSPKEFRESISFNSDSPSIRAAS